MIFHKGLKLALGRPGVIRGASCIRASSTSSKKTSSTVASSPLAVNGEPLVDPKYTFDSANLQIDFTPPGQLQQKPPLDQLGFGVHFSDHIFKVRWNANKGWATPHIEPLAPFQMHPAAKVLHYAQELYEGMKGYRGHDGKVRLFRPHHNMVRMNFSAERACLPTFDGPHFLNCIQKLIDLDQEWVPQFENSSLYIRPTMIGIDPSLGVGASSEVDLYVILSPVGPYFAGGFKPVSLLADPKYVRAWPGGCGFVKMGSNYAPTLWTQKIAEKEGCQQCLWLLGEDHEITEVGAMNIFVVMKKSDGKGLELVTPPLTSGCILPGITRQSVLELTQEWNEFDVVERKLTMHEVMKANEEGRLVEMFGCGTAVVVCPVGNIKYNGVNVEIPVDTSATSVSQRCLQTLRDIQYGALSHPWAVEIGNNPDISQLSPIEKERLETYTQSIRQHLHL